MLRTKNINKSFSGVKVLDKVSLLVEKGKVVGLLGANGAGKTTTMRVISGFLKADSGEVIINKKKVGKGVGYKKEIGYLPEGNPLYEQMTVLEYLHFIAKMREVEEERRVKEVLEVVRDCGLLEVYEKKIDILSKGFKQRVGLASALLGSPKILILDEPTSGLDPKQRVEIRKLIKKLAREKAVLISSHILSEIEQICNEIVVIQKGEVAWSGKIKDLGKGAKKRLILIVKRGKEKSLRIGKVVGVKIKVVERSKEWRIIFEGKNKKVNLSKKALELAGKKKWEVIEMKEEKGNLEKEFLKLIK